MTHRQSPGSTKSVVFIRTGPIDLTPAVPRYIAFLRQSGFQGELRAMEYAFIQRKNALNIPVTTMTGEYRSTFERVTSILKWQWFQLRELRRQPPDVIQICDVFSGIPALLGKYGTGAYLVFDIRDNIRLATRHRGRMISRLLQLFEFLVANASDSVVVVNDALLEELPQRIARRAIVIPNSPLIDSFRELHFSSSQLLRVNLAGFVSYRRNLETWCEAQVDGTIELDLYGSIVDKQTRDILSTFGLSTVSACSHAESLQRMSTADIVSLMYDPAVGINRYASPNKYYEALMLGKPVICSEGMKLSREVAEHGCGLSVPYGALQPLREAIAKLTNIETRLRMGRASRRLYETRYAGASARAMSRLYESILQDGEPSQATALLV